MVNGAARGLGNEFCRAFAQSGCTQLASLDLKEEESQEAAEELVKASCGQKFGRRRAEQRADKV